MVVNDGFLKCIFLEGMRDALFGFFFYDFSDFKIMVVGIGWNDDPH